MAELRGQDVACTLPAGWDGRITVRNEGAVESFRSGPVDMFVAKPQPVVHLANFGLPEERGDFGSGAVELMGTRDVFMVLFEYEPEAVSTPLFKRRGIPRQLSTNAFDATMLRRGIPGQAGYQTFFQEAGRAFCLYIVLGNGRKRAPLVDLVNRVLATVRIEPRTAG